MKKISLLLCLLFSALASAEPLGKQAALYTAKAYMTAKGKTVLTPARTRANSQNSTSANQEEEYYYVFNAGNDGGYVIVSGDDRVEPILGYVDQGSFEYETQHPRTDEIALEPRASLQPHLPEILQGRRYSALFGIRLCRYSYGASHQLL